MYVLIFLAALLVLAGGLAYFRAGRDLRDDASRSYQEDEFRWMPDELRSATLSQSEKQSYVDLAGARIPVRPDQVYRTSDGRLIPVETKTRRGTGVFLYDVIELSVQRLAVAKSAGANAAHYGYVRIKDRQGNRRPTYKRVDLLHEGQLTALYHRYLGVVSGQITPTSQDNPNACKGCSYRSVCPKAL